MNIKRLNKPTKSITSFVETYPELDFAFGSYATKMKVYNADVSRRLGVGVIGGSVLGSLNSGELSERIKLLTKLIKPKRIVAINLGRSSSAVGGGKSYEEMLKNRWNYKEKINRAVEPIESLVNTHGCKVQKNDYGAGAHGIAQAESNKKIDYLDLPYKVNVFGIPQDEYSERNFPELLSYWYKQKKYQNIIYNNPEGNRVFDYVGAILSHAILGRTISGTTDGIDISDVWIDLKSSRIWTLTPYISTDPRFKVVNLIPFWTRPHIDRQIDTLSRVVKRAEPTKDDIIFVVGNFSKETIDSVKSVVNQEIHVKPRIRHLLCEVLPEGINCIVGKLSPYKFQPVDTPHFDEMEYLMESDW